MQKVNYQKKLEAILGEIADKEKPPRLLLHSCCAPCSSYVLEYLSGYFSITIFYYNPNITDDGEYQTRVQEQKRLIESLPARHKISFLEGCYEPEKFFAMAKGLEKDPEGGKRCFACYRMRMEEAAALAAENGFDYFTTTLTLSPLKNAEKINEIGRELEALYPVRHLPSDFKKKGGYQRSLELSRKYQLYRQNYCGCVFSQRRD